MDFKSLRTQSGMTQMAFSKKFKIPRRTIENWEYNISTPPIYVLELIEFRLRAEGYID